MSCTAPRRLVDAQFDPLDPLIPDADEERALTFDARQGVDLDGAAVLGLQVGHWCLPRCGPEERRHRERSETIQSPR
jgi:hypothetical protein